MTQLSKSQVPASRMSRSVSMNCPVEKISLLQNGSFFVLGEGLGFVQTAERQK
jgi:hypothetical protein